MHASNALRVCSAGDLRIRRAVFLFRTRLRPQIQFSIAKARAREDLVRKSSPLVSATFSFRPPLSVRTPDTRLAPFRLLSCKCADECGDTRFRPDLPGVQGFQTRRISMGSLSPLHQFSYAASLSFSMHSRVRPNRCTPDDAMFSATEEAQIA